MCFAFMKSIVAFACRFPFLQLLQVLSGKSAGWACASLTLSS